MTEIDKLAWLNIQHHRVLAVRSRGKELYYIPGGKREAGETDEQALTREIREELSVDLQQDTLHYYDTFRAQADGKPMGTEVKITCYKAEHTGELATDSEIDEMRWLSYSDRDKCSLVVQIILDQLKQQQLIN
ncbi:NUDIX hydrolase [Endozoicomonadaceae bacterium StTr2]